MRATDSDGRQVDRATRSKGAETERGYELRYFARKYGLSTAQAMQIIRQHGTDRAKLNAAGARLRRENQSKARG
jgi:hypothetical protein